MRYLTLIALLCLDLFVMARLDEHPVQWMFLAFASLAIMALVIHLRSEPRAAKESKENGLGSANGWILTPVAFFALKLLSNSIFTGLNGHISMDAQAYFLFSGLFWFSIIFLGLAIGLSLKGNKLSNSLVVAFFSILFIGSFLFFMFCLLLFFDESWDNMRF